MLVRFSRHAKRRAKLYKIPMATIRGILENMDLREGEYEFINDLPDSKFPIKIVIVVEGDVATVITNYPLKKGRKK